MFQLITKIPLFVWPLFFVLLHGGLRARKKNAVPIARMCLVPLIFFSWSLFSFFGKYARDPVNILFWFLCLGLGCLIGFSQMQRMKLQFNRQNKKVEMPGSWIHLILSMSIFASKFSVGMMSVMMPHLAGSLLFLGIELFAAIILGVFAGRTVNCLVRYRAFAVDAKVAE